MSDGMSRAEAEMFVRQMTADMTREANEHREFVVTLPPLTNIRLKTISREYEPHFEPLLAELITRVWSRHQNMSLADIECILMNDWINYELGEECKPHRKEIRDRVDRLMKSFRLYPPEERIEQVVQDIISDAADRLTKRLFTEHLRREGVTKAAIRRLYPLPVLNPVERIIRRLNEDYLYNNRPIQKRQNVVPIRPQPG